MENVVKYGDVVEVNGYKEDKEHVLVEGTIVGISDYCYTVKDDNGKEWDVDTNLVKTK